LYTSHTGIYGSGNNDPNANDPAGTQTSTPLPRPIQPPHQLLRPRPLITITTPSNNIHTLVIIRLQPKTKLRPTHQRRRPTRTQITRPMTITLRRMSLHQQ